MISPPLTPPPGAGTFFVSFFAGKRPRKMTRMEWGFPFPAGIAGGWAFSLALGLPGLEWFGRDFPHPITPSSYNEHG